MIATKTCSMCRETKAVSEFYKYRKGTRAECKSCSNKRSKDYYEANIAQQQAVHQKWQRGNPDYLHGYHLRSQYGLTPGQYDELLASQGGVCAICREPETAIHPKTGTPRRLAVDHDHSCCPGERSCGQCVRGLLCHRCNTGLGSFLDDPLRLESALEYLKIGVRI